MIKEEDKMFFKGQTVRKAFGKSGEGVIVRITKNMWGEDTYAVKWKNNVTYVYRDWSLMLVVGIVPTEEEVLGV